LALTRIQQVAAYYGGEGHELVIERQ
jgi:hypothetical protein